MLALILILLLVFSRLSCITQRGYRQGYFTHTHSSIGVDWMHIHYSKDCNDTLNPSNFCNKFTNFIFAYSSPRLGAKQALD